MKIVILTHPTFLQEEDKAINAMFNEGLDILHIRKPYASEIDMIKLIEKIEPQFHNKIAIHDNFQIAKEYNIGGLHTNSRNHTIPEWFNGRISSSCHTIDEIIRIKVKREYVFLSPIFNSISKQGYNSTFEVHELKDLQTHGIIDNKIYALGGIELSNLSLIKQLGFGGAVLLGDIWRKYDINNPQKIISHFIQIIRKAQT